MIRSFVYKAGRQTGDVSFNVTPLIDCTFLLIIFFVLTSQMASDNLATLLLPRPHASLAAAGDRREVRRLIVNVLSAQDQEGVDSADRAGQAAAYKIEGRRVEVGDFETLAALLRARRAEARPGELLLEVRADRRVQFGHVQPIIDAAAEAGISPVSLTALLERAESP
ncbi:MAG: biopolymer transporter ExbD [Phycisphaerae bacterium]|nr:biopolymer transporter ExbD [Phycisphaerae bacterium]